MDRLVLLPGKRQTLGDQLRGQILQQIVAGQLRAGERLASEQTMARKFEVSRPIVRPALLRLRADGLVEARQGAGTFVLQRPTQRPTPRAKAGRGRGCCAVSRCGCRSRRRRRGWRRSGGTRRGSPRSGRR